MTRQNASEQELRSIHNRHSSFVKFLNMTRHNVSIYWIDYQGKMVRYKLLGSQDYIDINTFVTHPWIFIEELTKDRFLGNGSKVYFPEPWWAKYCRGGTQRSKLPARIERTHVYITSPMYTLRELCLRAIKRRLRRDRDAYSLEIPRSLQHELHSMHPRKPELGLADQFA